MERIQRFVGEMAARTETARYRDHRQLAFVEEIEELKYEEVRSCRRSLPARPPTHSQVLARCRLPGTPVPGIRVLVEMVDCITRSLQLRACTHAPI